MLAREKKVVVCGYMMLRENNDESNDFQQILTVCSNVFFSSTPLYNVSEDWVLFLRWIVVSLPIPHLLVLYCLLLSLILNVPVLSQKLRGCCWFLFLILVVVTTLITSSYQF